MTKITPEIVHKAFCAASSATNPKSALNMEADTKFYCFDSLADKDKNEYTHMAAYLEDRYKQSDLSGGVVYLASSYASGTAQLAYLDLSPAIKSFYTAIAAAILAQVLELD